MQKMKRDGFLKTLLICQPNPEDHLFLDSSKNWSHWAQALFVLLLAVKSSQLTQMQWKHVQVLTWVQSVLISGFHLSPTVLPLRFSQIAILEVWEKQCLLQHWFGLLWGSSKPQITVKLKRNVKKSTSMLGRHRLSCRKEQDITKRLSFLLGEWVLSNLNGRGGKFWKKPLKTVTLKMTHYPEME